MDLLDGKPIVVLIDDELIANRKTNRPYIHVVTLTKKKHQADVAVSIAVLGDKNLVTHPQGEIAKVLQAFISSNKNEK